MNSILLDQWNERIDKGFPGMGRWQKRLLAGFSYGVVLAQSCRLNSLAQQLTGRANASSMERGLQRWLGNERIVMKVVFLVVDQLGVRVVGKSRLADLGG